MLVKYCDVLIIGGGIIGCSIANDASKYGRDVTILGKGNECYLLHSSKLSI